MAGSRLEKFGTVFTRVRDLMRAGVIKHEERPIWFDVYAAFPPKREPLYEKAVRPLKIHAADNVPDIFYKEDEIRAKFFEVSIDKYHFVKFQKDQISSAALTTKT
ncbi:28S ribosomal protein S23, mitochondrial-like [Sinocyclocheilus grahami]|uniref:28S ribosomal protein S23, mitochondrial-like n=1 Tax=Sinocyclocheilus grahami TaxID=75366 RepID=UPI0007ACF3D3|nr:PREDICTED: 28S ribosomal protein S23, mitochondrial-like [Sinocyclocheilus grahami]